jgi:hypothetical protein
VHTVPVTERGEQVTEGELTRRIIADQRAAFADRIMQALEEAAPDLEASTFELTRRVIANQQAASADRTRQALEQAAAPESAARLSDSEQLHREHLEPLHELILLLREPPDAGALAHWFRTPNRLLNGKQPVSVLATGDVAAVQQAAEVYLSENGT